jgi:hypothetical protein
MPATGSSTQQQLRFLRQQHADLQPLFLAMGKHAGAHAASVL